MPRNQPQDSTKTLPVKVHLPKPLNLTLTIEAAKRETTRSKLVEAALRQYLKAAIEKNAAA